jgi:adenylosuccinate synthase
MFFSELDTLDPTYGLRERTRVDYRCPLIDPEHRLQERESAFLNETVGTTASGTGAALAAFTLRQARQTPALADYTTDVAHELNEACKRGETVITEGSQGTHLSLALSDDYPHCTSDNYTTAAFADDVGLNWQHIREVVLVVKALPSRVGTGPLPLQLDSAEEDRRNIAEYGVRTGRRRRKAAGLSWPHLETAVELNGPTQLALTFCDHLDPLAAQARTFAELPTSVRQLVDELEERSELPVTLCDCGKNFEHIIERS